MSNDRRAGTERLSTGQPPTALPELDQIIERVGAQHGARVRALNRELRQRVGMVELNGAEAGAVAPALPPPAPEPIRVQTDELSTRHDQGAIQPVSPARPTPEPQRPQPLPRSPLSTPAPVAVLPTAQPPRRADTAERAPGSPRRPRRPRRWWGRWGRRIRARRALLGLAVAAVVIIALGSGVVGLLQRGGAARSAAPRTPALAADLWTATATEPAAATPTPRTTPTPTSTAASPVASSGTRSAAGDESCFPETGKCLRGIFHQYWQWTGGLARHGYPISDQFEERNPSDGKSYTVQYFERARFEHHPEYQGTEYEVLLGLLGWEQFQAKYPDSRPPGGDGDVCFAETGRCLRGPFYQYWLATGGLARHGYPISDEFEERSPTDGKPYTVQYFERARFELHPENAGTPGEILLGLLGWEQYTQQLLGGTPVMRDDFATPGDWTTGDFPGRGTISYSAGGYHMVVTGSLRYLWGTHPSLQDVTDLRVEVDAARLNARPGNARSAVGIMCRVQNDNAFYVLRVDGNGRFVIERNAGVEGRLVLASGGPTPAMHQGNEVNRIRADCVGNTLTLYVNGEKVAEATDENYPRGGLALYAGTDQVADLDVVFRKLVVVKP